MPPSARPSRVFKNSDRYKNEAKTLGIRVRSLRNERSWTLEQAAEHSQIDWKHWQKIESGLLNVTLVTLVRLAMGLGVTLQALFEQSEPET
jgi:transcriptional regulator with XRE-family HTH domain